MDLFISIASVAVSAGLLIDRYVLMHDRLIAQMIEKAKREGKCIICQRPMKIVSE